MKGWGEEKGAVVVVSHDKNFCSNIDFTHVVTVNESVLKVEEREARENDWVVSSLSLSETEAIEEIPISAEPVVDAAVRKRIFNAPKRIAKLEELVEETDLQIAKIDEEMMANGSDVGKLVDLTKAKDALTEKVDMYMAEWEELESLMATMA